MTEVNEELALWLDGPAHLLGEVDDLVRVDTDGVHGYTRLLDVEQSFAWALRWLGQFVGVKVPVGASEEEARNLVRESAGMARGTPATMEKVIRRHLTGTKVVKLEERDTSPYHFSVTTYTQQTPDSSKVQAAILAAKPAGLQFTYQVLDGQTWNDLNTSTQNWQQVFDNYADWEEVASTIP